MCVGCGNLELLVSAVVSVAKTWPLAGCQVQVFASLPAAALVVRPLGIWRNHWRPDAICGLNYF